MPNSKISYPNDNQRKQRTSHEVISGTHFLKGGLDLVVDYALNCHLCGGSFCFKSIITSSVDGSTFSVVHDSDVE